MAFVFGKDTPAHEKIYHYLNNCGLAEVEATAKILNRLRKHRNEADYDMASKKYQNHVECQWDIVHAQGVISQIEKYSKEPLRMQLGNGLREYQTKIKS